MASRQAAWSRLLLGMSLGKRDVLLCLLFCCIKTAGALQPSTVWHPQQQEPLLPVAWAS